MVFHTIYTHGELPGLYIDPAHCACMHTVSWTRVYHRRSGSSRLLRLDGLNPDFNISSDQFLSLVPEIQKLYCYNIRYKTCCSRSLTGGGMPQHKIEFLCKALLRYSIKLGKGKGYKSSISF